MKIELNEGIYTRDDEAKELLTAKEEETLAGLANKLVIRRQRREEEERQRQEAYNRALNGEVF